MNNTTHSLLVESPVRPFTGVIVGRSFRDQALWLVPREEHAQSERPMTSTMPMDYSDEEFERWDGMS